MRLKGKNIVLGITGSIAAYKAAYLLRALKKEGADVQVIITPAGKEFITPVTLSALSNRPVISEFFSANSGSWNSHVDLGLWADLFVVAPASASTIAKMAHGLADNMLITSYLSTRAKVMVAPAMDLDMFSHPTTVQNIGILKANGHIIIEPASGELASGLIGKGRMEEPEVILEHIVAHFAASQILAGKTVLITAGPTYERIDPVRFIGNHSSGKMGFAIAEQCAQLGAKVVLVAGPVSLPTPQGHIERINVVSAGEMYEAAVSRFNQCHFAIMSAAVADFTPAHSADEKIKRGDADLSVQLKPTKDIAAQLGSLKRNDQILVGFALETQDETNNALNKLSRKNLDFIVLNSLNDTGAGFGGDTNKVTIWHKSGKMWPFELKSKTLVARDIISVLVENMQ